MNAKTKNILTWVISIALAAFFGMTSFGKLSGGMAEEFVAWGYSANFAYIIGGLELASVIGLLITPVRKFAAMGLILIMLGAAYTHITNDEISSIGINIGVIVACVALVVVGRQD